MASKFDIQTLGIFSSRCSSPKFDPFIKYLVKSARAYVIRSAITGIQVFFRIRSSSNQSLCQDGSTAIIQRIEYHLLVLTMFSKKCMLS